MNNKKIIIILAAAMTLSACSSDTISSGINAEKSFPGDACNTATPCLSELVCAYGICMKADDPCVETQCDEGILCRDGECQKSNLCGEEECGENQVCQNNICKDLCGNSVCKEDELCAKGECQKACGGVLCEAGETCIENNCVKEGKCAGIMCGDDEICYKDACRPAGDCGGAECLETEICQNNRCHETGDCGGSKCESGETCHENSCVNVGDCGGIECPSGTSCDYYNAVCRQPGDCSGLDCGEFAYCAYNTFCVPKQQCGDIYCDGGYICQDGTCVPSSICPDGKDRCNTECCTDDQFCGTSNRCCDKASSCGQDCCSEGQVCENELCHKACDAGVTRCAKEDGTEFCCSAGEICVSHMCYKPTVTCVDDYQCENGEYCESTEHICLPTPTGPVCQQKPTGGEVQPTLEWYWGETAPSVYPEYVQVMSSPMVADINDDGETEIVFNTFSGGSYQGNGVLRILNGKNGTLVASSNKSPFTDGGSQTAIGDVIKDKPGLEIATCTIWNGYYKIALYDNKANLIWQSQTGNYNECGQSGPSIIDFNGDGQPEIYSRYIIYNGKTGKTLARIPGYESTAAHGPADYTTAADLDGDGLPELVGGNIAYKVNIDVANDTATLTKLYDRSGDGHIDGYPAVADLNLDGKPEIVVVRSNNNTIMAFNADGTNHWTNPTSYSAGAGGPPTIANLDSTPNPEVTFAGKYAYVTFNADGSPKWSRYTHDYSSAKTGSSVFDFDGDGKAEVVYADEYFLRVYDGESGNTRFCKCNTSGTHWEYPVIADVNNDNHAEIIVSSNNSMTGSCPTSLPADQGWDECVDKIMKSPNTADRAGTHGVRVFSSPNKDWVPTRKIYNQHAYSVTNVSDDGTIPIKVRNNWTTPNLNNFRLNVQPGATYLPDLEIQSISSPRECGESIPVYFNVVNVGWAAAKPGITVHILASVRKEGPYKEVGSVQTTKTLRATEIESLKFDFQMSSIDSDYAYLRLQFDNNLNECRTDNNASDYQIDCTSVY